MDLRSESNLDARLEHVLLHHNAIRRGLKKKIYKKKDLKEELLKIAPKILKFAQPVWLRLDEYKKKKKKILFEGAQGILLDVDHGTYPFVTSSNTVPAMAATGTGSGPNTINYVLGITKAYTTRVGSGPFPTELVNKVGESLGRRGKEFGTVTSRKRRCGWFDGVLVRQTIKVAGITGIALTKLDVLDELNEIKMCIEYELNGEKMDYLPAASEDQFNVKPIYKTFPGWKTSTQGVRNMEELPEKAKNYINAIEDFIGAKISSISTSPEREDTILIEDPFEA
jgi:adenylosuccinate synthase